MSFCLQRSRSFHKATLPGKVLFISWGKIVQFTEESAVMPAISLACCEHCTVFYEQKDHSGKADGNEI